ncbi:hypothetical protein CLLI_10480 [Clostridium liquoris]|jgi:hypothetical protein|uniref:Uncharacterized protein n=1 Tax=Clostridium liquoris TaxID=1289519 RepID=A0A2T0B5X4_9CLOT|nr:hypothetical protein [Clostridium liquoris]PRR79203.1 hypothetical protein CLLI_10480 [Clostridium liquoris]
MANDFEKILKDKKVINKEDVLKLKNYIKIKFKNFSSKDQASILSSTINDIIINSLKDIKNDLKNQLRIAILKNTFLDNKDIICLYDVFLVITSEEFKDKISVDNICKWLQASIDVHITETELKTYLGFDKKDNTCEAIVHPVLAEEKVIGEVTNVNSVPGNKGVNKSNKLYRIIALCTLIFLVTGYSYKKIDNNMVNLNKNTEIIKLKSDLKEMSFEEQNTFPGIPKYFEYKDISTENLKNFLNSKNSILADEPYFSAILKSSKDFNLNPLILFAITGQEQHFVPKSEKDAKKIANNPFNVFHSWQEYNTNIKDSSTIAARTVVNLCKDRPPKEDPFKWINQKYSGDKNWWKGVKAIYEELNAIVKE